MSVDVIMPQMGESIAEGTVTKWLKKVGDAVKRDEPLFEISTDKVDAEIPSPAAGVLSEILVGEGKTVGVNTVVARIGAEAAAGAGAAETKAPPAAAAAAPQRESAPAPAPARPEIKGEPGETDGRRDATVEELRRTRSSPVVRKMAAEHGVDIASIQGTGISGRVTKQDLASFLESGQPSAGPGPGRPSGAAPSVSAPSPAAPSFRPGEGMRVEPMSVMRKKIAEHMVMSKRTSAHVTTFFEVDMTPISRLRDRHKKAFEAREGVKLTFLPFVALAAVEGIRKFPIINASVDGDNVVYKRDVNLGIAVALDWGLIVPVIKRADEKNLIGIARAIADLGERARIKKLTPDDVTGGTFTITNPGGFGGLVGTPIINQPQVAIMGVGVIEKRPVVIDDAIAIRTMAILSLSFDHRIIDGADADRYMAHVKQILQTSSFGLDAA
ncbi:MAG: 2-oxoglutarate dehydrogenase, E2 component, dihydrolipoamide succinyltransferase [Candidatus Polarisedimenticolia bacterium]